MTATAADLREFDRLRALSARIGADPLLVQAAGGNSSIKLGEAMWIKASGTRLAEATAREIMTPVDLPALRRAFARGDPAAETALAFVREAENPPGLRPSIETTVHAVFPQRVVLHVHCVNAIALAVRRDAEAAIAPRLAGLAWAFVPYVRPGAPLARLIAAALRPDTDLVVLGNHGLIAAAATVAEAAALLGEASWRLTATARPARPPDMAALAALAAGSDYRPAPDPETHQAALEEWSLRAAEGSLYPDHVIFLGVGAAALRDGESLGQGLDRFAAAGAADPAMILVPGRGTLLRRSASPGARALARCLSDVLRRVPPGAALRHLTPAENHELLNWEAEKYRRSLDAG